MNIDERIIVKVVVFHLSFDVVMTSAVYPAIAITTIPPVEFLVDNLMFVGLEAAKYSLEQLTPCCSFISQPQGLVVILGPLDEEDVRDNDESYSVEPNLIINLILFIRFKVMVMLIVDADLCED